MESAEFEKQPVQVELMQEGDIKETAEVYALAFNKASVGEHWTQEAAEEFITYWFKRQPDLFFVAKIDGKIVGGAVAAVKPWCTGPKLVDGELFVHPDHQGKGIASLVSAKRIEEAIKKYGITEFEATADTEEDFPQEWYGKLGLEKTRWAVFSGKPEKMLKALKGS